MLKIDIINCKKEKATKAYLFALSMAFEKTTIGNISIIKDLNTKQLGLIKENLY